MNQNQSPNFQSLYGFKELTLKKTNVFSRLKEIFQWSEKLGFSSDAREEYSKIRLLDTFFSDSFPENLINLILDNQNKHKYSIEILLINPNSPIADSRAKALGLNQFDEINEALKMIRHEIYNLESRLDPLNKKSHIGEARLDFMHAQLDELNLYKSKYNLEIKFYNVLTDVPIYIISQFVVKGQILYSKSAADNPWMIFVDDLYQSNDLYDALSENFDKIWKISNLSPVRVRANSVNTQNVFVSHGRNAAIKKIVSEFVQKQNFKPILYKNDSIIGDTIVENLEKLTNQCSYAIVIMTKEDFQINNNVRTRQNVIHELGWCQALYGRKHVLILVEEGTELPSNIDGISHKRFNNENIENIESAISSFLELRSLDI